MTATRSGSQYQAASGQHDVALVFRVGTPEQLGRLEETLDRLGRQVWAQGLTGIK